jgi:hypothetical protein
VAEGLAVSRTTWVLIIVAFGAIPIACALIGMTGVGWGP